MPSSFGDEFVLRVGGGRTADVGARGRLIRLQVVALPSSVGRIDAACEQRQTGSGGSGQSPGVAIFDVPKRFSRQWMARKLPRMDAMLWPVALLAQLMPYSLEASGHCTA